jgi:uncharacterized repeat protein (TIGR01451 family)
LPPITITAVAGREGRYNNCAEIDMKPREGPRGGSLKDTNPQGNRDCVDGEIRPDPKPGYDVSLRKLGGGTTPVGGQISFTFSPFNKGPGTVTAVTITDLIPGGLTSIPAPTGSPWNCSGTQPMTCPYNGLPVGPILPLPSFTIQGTAQAPAGEFENCAQISIDGATDIVPQDNGDCRSYVVTPRSPTGTGTLTIVKVSQPVDAQAFNFTTQGAGLSGFTLDGDPNTPLPNSQTFTNLAAGTSFTVTEGEVSGWTVPSLQCIPDIIGTSTTYTDQLNRTFTVTIAAGVHMTCTFTNLKEQGPPTGTGRLTIVKVSQPVDAQAFNFTTQGAGLSGFTLDGDPNTPLPNSQTFTNLAAGTSFTVTEGEVSGWTVPSLQCIPDIIGTSTTYTDQLNRTFTVTIAAGVHMTCTFTNLKGQGAPDGTFCDDGNGNTVGDVWVNGVCLGTPIGTGSITIKKDAVPNDGQDFEFLLANDHSFIYLDDDNDGVRSDQHLFSGLAAGVTYTFTETAVPGWSLTGIVCIPSAGTTTNVADRTVTVDLAVGGNVTCTFTNEN